MENQNHTQPSKDVQKFMVINSIETVEELIAIPDEVLIEMPGFGWRLLKEILLLRNIQ